mgnify:CR=1 FL=1
MVLKEMDAHEQIRQAAEWFPGQICLSSSLSMEDQVLLHIIATRQLPVKIFTLDTGRMFPETYDLLEKSISRYKIPITLYYPDQNKVEEMVNRKGINLFYYSIDNRKECCGVRKLEPLARALKGMKVWITGLRREQSPTRVEMQTLETDSSYGIYKLNPLIEWSGEQLREYVTENNIPYNSLHDKGYPSIGCQPCTRAIQPGEDIRAGRWWWENPETRECGLHKH